MRRKSHSYRTPLKSCRRRIVVSSTGRGRRNLMMHIGKPTSAMRLKSRCELLTCISRKCRIRPGNVLSRTRCHKISFGQRQRRLRRPSACWPCTWMAKREGTAMRKFRTCNATSAASTRASRRNNEQIFINLFLSGIKRTKSNKNGIKCSSLGDRRMTKQLQTSTRGVHIQLQAKLKRFRSTTLCLCRHHHSRSQPPLKNTCMLLWGSIPMVISRRPLNYPHHRRLNTVILASICHWRCRARALELRRL